MPCEKIVLLVVGLVIVVNEPFERIFFVSVAIFNKFLNDY